MTFEQRLMIMAALAGVLAAALVRRKPGPTESRTRVPRGDGLVAASLAVVSVALLAVGVVSHTLVRHIIQTAPVIVALGLVAGRPAWGPGPGGVAHRSLMPNKLALRALPAGRRAPGLMQRITLPGD